MKRKNPPIKKHEQGDLSALEEWEDREPNVSFTIVDGKLIERPVPPVANVASRKNRR